MALVVEYLPRETVDSISGTARRKDDLLDSYLNPRPQDLGRSLDL